MDQPDRDLTTPSPAAAIAHPVLRLPPLAVVAGGRNCRMQSLSGTLYKGFLPVEHMSLVTKHIVRAALSAVPAVWVLVDADDPLARRQLETLPVPVHESRCHVHYEVVEGTVEDKLRHFIAVAGVRERFLMVLGDTVAGVDLGELVESTAALDIDSSIGVAPFRLPFGRIELTPDGSRVAAFVEKPRLELLVNTGYLCLGREAMQLLGDHDLTGTLDLLSRAEQLVAVLSTTEISSIDSPVDLARWAGFATDPDHLHQDR